MHTKLALYAPSRTLSWTLRHAVHQEPFPQSCALCGTVLCCDSPAIVPIPVMKSLQARDTQSGELMAVKIYNLPALGELNKVQLIREIRLHGACAHRNIIELYVAFQVRSSGPRVPYTCCESQRQYYFKQGVSDFGIVVCGSGLSRVQPVSPWVGRVTCHIVQCIMMLPQNWPDNAVVKLT